VYVSELAVTKLELLEQVEGAGFSPALPRLADNPTTVGSGFLSKWVALDVCRAVLELDDPSKESDGTSHP